MAYYLTVDARDEADQRVRAERDEDEVRQEQHVERHADDVRDIHVQHIEERTGPAEQADEFTASRQPYRAEQNRQSDGEIERVAGGE